MKASPACFELIKRFEGLKLEAYRCPAGIWTIGWGHTQGVQSGHVINRPTAELLLHQDVALVESDLASVLPETLQLTQGQYDALVSLCFNLDGGAPGLQFKAPKLWAALRYGAFFRASREFLDMDHALVNGKPVELPGLKARREAEAALFLA